MPPLTRRKAARLEHDRSASAFGLLVEHGLDELVLETFGHLSALELATCMAVSRSWRCLASDDRLWQRLTRDEFGRRPFVEQPADDVLPLAASTPEPTTLLPATPGPSGATSSTATVQTVPATPRGMSAARSFAEMCLAGRAAMLLGELEFVGFYEECCHEGTYHMAFWMRAWPTRMGLLDCMASHDPSLDGQVGLEGIANYVYLNPPPGNLSWEEHGRPFLGQWGGEAFRATWDPRSHDLRSMRTDLVAGVGPQAATDIHSILGLTPRFHLRFGCNGHDVAAAATYQGTGMAVRMQGLLRGGAEAAEILRYLRPAADLSGLPPGNVWRPRRVPQSLLTDCGWALETGFLGFDEGASRSSEYQAELNQWRARQPP